METRHAVLPVGDARVHYATTGSGPGLVFVHGTGADAETTWGELATRFAKRNTVILPDMSGAPGTEDGGGPLTVEGLAGQVAAVIDETGAGPVDMVALSMGAPIAVAVAATRPELVQRLVLAGGWARTDSYVHNLMTVWRRLADDPEAFGRFAVLTAYSPAHVNGLGPGELAELVAVVRPTPGTLRQIDLDLRVDVRDLLPRVRAETLVIGCGQDGTIPVSNARELHAGIADSSYVELDCGHVAHVERAEDFAKLLEEFLSGTTRPAPLGT